MAYFRGNEKIPVGEKEICEKYGLTKTPASGAFWKHKSDATQGECRYEIKETDKDGLRITIDWLEKIRREARLMSQDPRLIVRIKDQIWVMTPAGEHF